MKKESTIKLFLTSGITVTVTEGERLSQYENEISFDELLSVIGKALDGKKTLEFTAELKHIYKDKKDKEQEQEVIHKYYIPYDKISWYMKEEV